MEIAVCALCRHFGADAVVIVGSQAILASWPDSPVILRTSGEIDAYPANAKQWEAQHGLEASEEINALFGYLSSFHQTYGFYVDGVDEATATLPADWRDRQVTKPMQCDGRMVFAVAPSLEDLAISKVCRFDPSDLDYVRALHSERPLDTPAMQRRIRTLQIPDEQKARAIAFVGALTIP